MLHALPTFHATLLADTFLGMPSGQAAVLLSGLVLIFTINRWRKNTVTKRPQASAPAPAAAPNPLSLRDITAEVHALLADVEETARRLTAQIDNRYVRLEQLMAEADEKIRMLERLQNIQPAVPQVAAQSRTTGMFVTADAASGSTSDRASGGTDAQRTLARLRQERGAPPAAQDPAYQPIYSLADAGKTAREIAQQLSRQPGEIELILALRQRA